MTPDFTINREHRERLAAIVRQYLDGEISAFAFDELTDPFRGSYDKTVKHVASTVWFHYDDCKNHFVNLTKPEWDYFQRLLLVLDSNDHIVKTTTLCWRYSQLLALLSFIGFALAAWYCGFGIHLLLIAIPFGIVSIGIQRYRNCARPDLPYSEVLLPFSTFSELASTYKSVSQFRKKRHPKHLPGPRIRSVTMEVVVSIPLYCVWAVLSPVALFFQMFPTTTTRTRVCEA